MRAIDDSLFPGEKVLWSGQPKQGLMFTWFDWIAIPFGIFWVGAAGFMGLITFAAGDAPADAKIIAVVSWDLAWFFSSAVLPSTRGSAANFYAITDRRALILSQGPSRALICRSEANVRHATSRQSRPTGDHLVRRAVSSRPGAVESLCAEPLAGAEILGNRRCKAGLQSHAGSPQQGLSTFSICIIWGNPSIACGAGLAYIPGHT